MVQLQDTAILLASELVTNAYRYSDGPAALRVRGLGGDRLRVSVWDTNPHIPPPFDQRSRPLCPVPAEAVGGRGLFLVCHYAENWGGYPLGNDLFGRGGKLLWCELGSPAAGHRRQLADVLDVGEEYGPACGRMPAVIPGKAIALPTTQDHRCDDPEPPARGRLTCCSATGRS